MKNETESIEAYLKRCESSYDTLQINAIKEADSVYDKENVPVKKRNYGEWIADAESDANMEEAIGYYLINKSNNESPYEHWHENTCYLFETGDVTEQDIEIEKILKLAFPPK